MTERRAYHTKLHNIKCIHNDRVQARWIRGDYAYHQVSTTP